MATFLDPNDIFTIAATMADRPKDLDDMLVQDVHHEYGLESELLWELWHVDILDVRWDDPLAERVSQALVRYPLARGVATDWTAPPTCSMRCGGRPASAPPAQPLGLRPSSAAPHVPAVARAVDPHAIKS